MKTFQQIDSHNSMLTNREMAILSAQIDSFALGALQSMRYESIVMYFNSVEHYYLKLQSLMQQDDVTSLEALRVSFQKLKHLVEENPKCRTKKSCELALEITKKFYSTVRSALQKGKYYFRTSQVKQKGLSNIQYDDFGKGEE